MIAWALLRGPVLALLTFGVTLPLWLILAAVLWWQIDKGSAVRRAVETAIEDLVDGQQLAAERASNEALRKILAERERQAERDRAALAAHAELLQAAEAEKGNLLDELSDLEAQPAPDRCTVDNALLERLSR